MVPRSGGTDSYVCRTNKFLTGAGSCAMEAHPRAEVDAAFLRTFERTFLDLDATRAHVATELHQMVADVEAQIASADAAESAKTAQLARVEADYLAEELGAAAYTRLSASLGEELQAATAERERLQARAVEVRATLMNLDSEEETLRRLAGLHEAIAAQARDAFSTENIEALRGVIAQVAEHYYWGSTAASSAGTPRPPDRSWRSTATVYRSARARPEHSLPAGGAGIAGGVGAHEGAKGTAPPTLRSGPPHERPAFQWTGSPPLGGSVSIAPRQSRQPPARS